MVLLHMLHCFSFCSTGCMDETHWQMAVCVFVFQRVCCSRGPSLWRRRQGQGQGLQQGVQLVGRAAQDHPEGSVARRAPAWVNPHNSARWARFPLWQ